MSENSEILIVGAGIAGLTTAFWLHQAGYRVRIIDSGRVGHESTWAGGGIISAVPPWAYPEQVNQLIDRSRELYPDLIGRLEHDTGIDCEYFRCGLVLTGWSEQRAIEWLNQHNIVAEHGSVAHFEPNISDPTQPAIHLPAVTQIRNPRLGKAFRAWLKQQSIPLTENTLVERILHQQDQVTGVRICDGTVLEHTQVVLACGAWTDRILRRSGLNAFGIRPVRGQMLLYAPNSAQIQRIVNTPDGYLIPRKDGRILAGSTVEHTGFDRRPSQDGYQRLRQMAERLLPELVSARIELQWSGLRPGISSQLPLCGPHSTIEGLWLQSGGFRNGLGIAPASAEKLGQKIVKQGTARRKSVKH